MKIHIYQARALLLTLAISFFSLQALSAAEGDLLGAKKALIKMVAEAKLKKTEKAEDENTQVATAEYIKLQADLEDYKSNKVEYDAKKSAEDWLALLDAYWNIPPKDIRGGFVSSRMNNEKSDPLTLISIIEALPSPSAWKQIKKMIGRRPEPTKMSIKRETGLKLFMCYLLGDYSDYDEHLLGLEETFVGQDRYAVETLKDQIAELRKDIQGMNIKGPSDIVDNYRKMLKSRLAVENEDGLQVSEINVPDLVTLVGEKEAKEMLQQTFKLNKVKVLIPAGGKTLKLAKKVALKNINTMSVPQWGLIDSLEDVAFYEAIDKKFSSPVKSEKKEYVDVFSANQYSQDESEYSYEKASASVYYVFGLIAQGELQKAIDFTVDMTESKRLEIHDLSYGFPVLDQSEYGDDLFYFITQVLDRNVELDLWGEYLAYARVSDRLSEAILKLEEVAGQDDVSLTQRAVVKSKLAEAYMDLGKVDEGIAILKAIPDMKFNEESLEKQVEFLSFCEDIGDQVINIGRLLERPEIISQGFELISNVKKQGEAWSENNRGAGTRYYGTSDPLYSLMELERYKDAEDFIVDRMAICLSKIKSGPAGDYYEDEYEMRSLLEKLVKIYNKTGRHNDVLYLLENAEWWGAKDIVGLDDEFILMAAQGLHSAKLDAKALEFLKIYLHEVGDNDRAYELLIDIQGQEAIAFLDALYARDRFEERPLIWKAHLLKEADMLERAEEVIRQALKIDPTDGEQPAGDRVRAYAVLAEILDKRGSKKDADFFRNVVKSVRVAEQGDEYASAGFVAKALKMYEEAQTLFVDAYCVQWRLAERLHAMGKYEEAEKHYEIAFKRMPEQFGRVASFCFGCEGVFEKKHSQSVAERVLLGLLEQGSERCQIYFLLGQLRESQERYGDAYEYFKKATEMDPDYLDAWTYVYNLKDAMFIPRKENDEMVLQMMRLDPLQRHTDLYDIKVVNPAGLWDVIEDNQRYYVEKPKKLLRLLASAKVMEAKEKESREGNTDSYQHDLYRDYSRSPIRNGVTPIKVLLMNSTASSILQMMGYEEGNDRYYDMF